MSDRDPALFTFSSGTDGMLRPLAIFAFHILITFVVLLLPGVLSYWFTPFTGLLLGFVVTSHWRSRTILVAWVPTTSAFLWELTHVLTSWDVRWAHMSRSEYAWNHFLGPHCGSSECVGKVITALLVGGWGYSFGGWCCLKEYRDRS